MDTESSVCSQCGGRLTFLGKFDAEGKPEPERQLTPYNRFVQQRYSDVQVCCSPAVPLTARGSLSCLRTLSLHARH